MTTHPSSRDQAGQTIDRYPQHQASLPDEELVDRAKQGDRQAFSQLAGRHANKVYAAALAMLRNPDEAQDISQDAFIKAYRHLRTLKEANKFGPWVCRIARQEAAAYWRKNFRWQTVFNRFQAQYETDAHESAPPSNQDLNYQTLFEYAAAHLSARAREIVLLHYMNDCSCEEIASHLQVTPGAVKSHLWKARKKMLKKLKKIGIHSFEEI